MAEPSGLGLAVAAVETPLPPSHDDGAVAGASRLVGGPWGRHALPVAGGRRWALLVALGVTLLVSLAGYAQKAPCLSHGYVDNYQYTHLCYTDTYALYSAEDLGVRTNSAGQIDGRISVPYRDHPVEYPPVIGGAMWLGAEATNLLHPHSGAADLLGRGRTFFDLTVLGLAGCALVSTWSIARIAGPRRSWDAVLVAASPVLLLSGFTNWDLVAVALTGLGLWAWSRGSPAWAGVLLGAGVATKLYPAFVLLALVMLCVRAGRVRAAATAVGTAALGVVVCYLPAIAVSRDFSFPGTCTPSHPLAGWRYFLTLSETRGADWGSVWLALQTWIGHPLDTGTRCGAAPTHLNLASSLAVLAAVVAVAALVAGARRRPRVGQVAFLLVASFVLLNKVDSPQYALWLVPLAVLARPRWTSLLVWQVSEVVLGAANLLTLVAQSTPGQGLSLGGYLILLVARDVILVVLLGLVVRDALHPERDIVRAGGVDDPAGGVLAGAPDHWRLKPRTYPAIPDDGLVQTNYSALPFEP